MESFTIKFQSDKSGPNEPMRLLRACTTKLALPVLPRSVPVVLRDYVEVREALALISPDRKRLRAALEAIISLNDGIATYEVETAESRKTVAEILQLSRRTD